MLREGNGVYDPEELALLGNVFDQAVAGLPPAMRTPANRIEIAKIILRCAAIGTVELAGEVDGHRCRLIKQRLDIPFPRRAPRS
jgi:hypothetical protein